MIRNCFLIVLCLMVSFCFGAEIPKEKRVAYKAEIESFALKKYPIVKKEVDREYGQALNSFVKYKNSKTTEEKIIYQEKILSQANFIESDLFWYLMDLAKITDKYINIINSMPPGDSYTVIIETLEPHLKKSKIDIDLAYFNLLAYCNSKARMIEKMAGVTYEN